MELLLLSKSRGSLGRLRVGVTLFVASLVVVSVVGLGFIRAGYSLGEQQTAEVFMQTNVRLESDWQNEVARQRELIGGARQNAERSLQALALRVASLQAHIARLDAVGARMVEKLDLVDDGFDFESAPGLGGSRGEQTPLEVDDFISELSKLSQELQDREDKFKLLESVYMRSQLTEKTTPSGRPIRKGWLSSRFGKRTDPINGTRDFHRGIDFAGASGTEIVAVADGIVTWSDKRYDYGNMVEIDHGNGYLSRYAHNKTNLVKLGERVSKGQAIALMGSTGRSTGPHVHYEIVHNGKIINPKSFIN